MGTQQITEFEGEQRRRFTRALLADLRALDHLIAAGLIEEGVTRIGAEQEMFLIDRTWHPVNGVLQAQTQFQITYPTPDCPAVALTPGGVCAGYNRPGAKCHPANQKQTCTCLNTGTWGDCQ